MDYDQAAGQTHPLGEGHTSPTAKSLPHILSMASVEMHIPAVRCWAADMSWVKHLGHKHWLRLTGLATSPFHSNLLPHGFDQRISGPRAGQMAMECAWCCCTALVQCVGGTQLCQTYVHLQYWEDAYLHGPRALEVVNPSTLQHLHRAGTWGQQDMLPYRVQLWQCGQVWANFHISVKSSVQPFTPQTPMQQSSELMLQLTCMKRGIFQFRPAAYDLFVNCLTLTLSSIWIIHRMITLYTEDVNFSVSVLLYKDLRFEDIETIHFC